MLAALKLIKSLPAVELAILSKFQVVVVAFACHFYMYMQSNVKQNRELECAVKI